MVRRRTVAHVAVDEERQHRGGRGERSGPAAAERFVPRKDQRADRREPDHGRSRGREREREPGQLRGERDRRGADRLAEGGDASDEVERAPVGVGVPQPSRRWDRRERRRSRRESERASRSLSGRRARRRRRRRRTPATPRSARAKQRRARATPVCVRRRSHRDRGGRHEARRRRLRDGRDSEPRAPGERERDSYGHERGRRARNRRRASPRRGPRRSPRRGRTPPRAPPRASARTPASPRPVTQKGKGSQLVPLGSSVGRVREPLGRSRPARSRRPRRA